MYTYNHWITDTEQPITAKAFTYTIWFPELGQRYIGYKTINSRSKWLNYKSSSKPVKELISNGHTAVYRIVKWFNDGDDALREEMLVLKAHNIFKRSEYLNNSIGGAFGKAGLKHTDEQRKKNSLSTTGVPKPSSQIGIWHTPYGSFNSITKVASDICGCDRTTIIRRCRSDSDKWKDWSFISNGKTHKSSGYSIIGTWNTPYGSFDSASKVSAITGITPHTIRSRCHNTNKKFKDWSFTPINSDKSQ